jgi:4-carboxymuconolactone decarboxylase
MTNQSNRERGKKVFKEVLLWDAPTGELSKFTAASIDFCFGEVWADPTLSIKQRRLISLTAAAFVGGGGLQSHVYGALNSGDFSQAELEAWVMHLSVYAGAPIATRAMGVVREEVQKQKDKK